jgi:hypothetical protein
MAVSFVSWQVIGVCDGHVSAPSGPNLGNSVVAVAETSFDQLIRRKDFEFKVNKNSKVSSLFLFFSFFGNATIPGASNSTVPFGMRHQRVNQLNVKYKCESCHHIRSFKRVQSKSHRGSVCRHHSGP